MSRVLISPKPVDKNGTRVPSVTFSVHEAGAWYTGTVGNYAVPVGSQVPPAVDIFATLNATTSVQSVTADLVGNVAPFYIDQSEAQLVIVGVVDGNYHIEPLVSVALMGPIKTVDQALNLFASARWWLAPQDASTIWHSRGSQPLVASLRSGAVISKYDRGFRRIDTTAEDSRTLLNEQAVTLGISEKCVIAIGFRFTGIGTSTGNPRLIDALDTVGLRVHIDSLNRTVLLARDAGGTLTETSSALDLTQDYAFIVSYDGERAVNLYIRTTKGELFEQLSIDISDRGDMTPSLNTQFNGPSATKFVSGEMGDIVVANGVSLSLSESEPVSRALAFAFSYESQERKTWELEELDDLAGMNGRMWQIKYAHLYQAGTSTSESAGRMYVLNANKAFERNSVADIAARDALPAIENGYTLIGGVYHLYQSGAWIDTQSAVPPIVEGDGYADPSSGDGSSHADWVHMIRTPDYFINVSTDIFIPGLHTDKGGDANVAAIQDHISNQNVGSKLVIPNDLFEISEIEIDRNPSPVIHGSSWERSRLIYNGSEDAISWKTNNSQVIDYVHFSSFCVDTSGGDATTAINLTNLPEGNGTRFNKFEMLHLVGNGVSTTSSGFKASPLITTYVGNVISNSFGECFTLLSSKIPATSGGQRTAASTFQMCTAKDPQSKGYYFGPDARSCSLLSCRVENDALGASVGLHIEASGLSIGETFYIQMFETEDDFTDAAMVLENVKKFQIVGGGPGTSIDPTGVGIRLANCRYGSIDCAVRPQGSNVAVSLDAQCSDNDLKIYTTNAMAITDLGTNNNVVRQDV